VKLLAVRTNEGRLFQTVKGTALLVIFKHKFAYTVQFWALSAQLWPEKEDSKHRYAQCMHEQKFKFSVPCQIPISSLANWWGCNVLW